MGHVEVGHLTYVLPDGRPLLDDVSFRVGDGVKAALVGPNGAGKTTLMRLIAGDLQPVEGSVASSGGLGVMRQFIGERPADGSGPVHDLLAAASRPPRVRQAAERLERAELAMMERDDEKTQMRYAAGASPTTPTPAATTSRCSGTPARWPRSACRTTGVKYRDVNTLSGGEQKRLVLEALLRGPDQTLLLDEPDNYLDVPGKLWLEQALRETPEDGAAGQPRPPAAGQRRRPHRHRRVRRRLGPRRRVRHVRRRPAATATSASTSCAAAGTRSTPSSSAWSSCSSRRPRTTTAMAPAYHAAQTRLRRFEEAGPPEAPPQDQIISDAPARRPHRQAGGRSARGCELTGLMQAVRPGDLVRRAGRGARLQRLGQVPLPAPARRGARSGTPARPGSAPGWCPATSCRRTPGPTCTAAPRARSS